MSLIRDALRRQQKEHGGGVPRPHAMGPERETEKVPHSDSCAPTPATRASRLSGIDSPAGGSRWARRLLLFCGTVILVLATVLITLWLLPATPPPDITAQHAPPAAETQANAAEPESDELSVQSDKEADALQEALPAFPSVQEELAEEPPPPEREEEPAIESVEPALADLVWPEIRISAAMGGSRGGSVLINGEIVPIGQRHGDLLIHEIRPDGVRIEYRGNQRIVPVRR